MALSIEARGREADGVRLIPPTDLQFDALARLLIGARGADTVMRLKPFLVIVANESTQPVVSLSIVWTVRYADGRTGTIKTHVSFPEEVVGDVLKDQSTGLHPSERRIEAVGIVVHQCSDLSDPSNRDTLEYFVREKDETLRDAVQLQINLNTVIFADGTLVGPDDNSWLSDLFTHRVQMKQQWYQDIVTALDAGHSVDEAFAPLRAFQADWIQRMKTDPRQALQERHDDERVSLRLDAAAEISRWRGNCEDDTVALMLREKIRLEPFVIRGK